MQKRAPPARLARRQHVVQLGQVALLVHDARVLQRAARLGRNVKGDDALRAALNQHLNQALPHEAAAARDNALGRHGREGAWRRGARARRHSGRTAALGNAARQLSRVVPFCLPLASPAAAAAVMG
jgi:hypothetical protein